MKLTDAQAHALLIKVIAELRELPNQLSADLETGSHHLNNAASEAFSRHYPRLVKSFDRLGALTNQIDID